jgi:hypothetical protein
MLHPLITSVTLPSICMIWLNSLIFLRIKARMVRRINTRLTNKAEIIQVSEQEMPYLLIPTKHNDEQQFRSYATFAVMQFFFLGQHIYCDCLDVPDPEHPACHPLPPGVFKNIHFCQVSGGNRSYRPLTIIIMSYPVTWV